MLHWLEGRDVRLMVDGAARPACGRDWQRVALLYQTGRLPIVAGCQCNDGPDSSAGELLARFIEEVGPAGNSRVKRRVVDHLKKTRFVVALELPTADMTEAGWDANGQILTYLVDYCGALIHAEGEGFYEGDKLILPMETA